LLLVLADVIFSIVGYPSDVRDIALGENGVIEGMKPGSIFVDMTTSEPSLAAEIAAAAEAKGAFAVDAPVSGGDVGARNATLSIMVKGIVDVLSRGGENCAHLTHPHF
jgi:3-hydroxyisobutyrate dehydrogenase